MRIWRKVRTLIDVGIMIICAVIITEVLEAAVSGVRLFAYVLALIFVTRIWLDHRREKNHGAVTNDQE